MHTPKHVDLLSFDEVKDPLTSPINQSSMSCHFYFLLIKIIFRWKKVQKICWHHATWWWYGSLLSCFKTFQVEYLERVFRNRVHKTISVWATVHLQLCNPAYVSGVDRWKWRCLPVQQLLNLKDLKIKMPITLHILYYLKEAKQQ